jgi:hypothetical protein
MNVEEALFILDKVLQKKLNNVQELVFCEAWVGKNYPEMAENACYNANYIKDVGYKLWKLISKTLSEKVTKSNFRAVLRRRYVACQHAWHGNYSVFERESLNVCTGDGVSEVDVRALTSGEEIASPQDTACEQETGESQQPPVVNTVLAIPLDAEEIKIKTQSTQADLVRETLKFVNAKTKTANTHSYWGETVAVSAFPKCTEEIKTLKQRAVNLLPTVTVLCIRGIGKTTVLVSNAKQNEDEFEYQSGLLHTPPIEEILLNLDTISSYRITQSSGSLLC